MIEEKKIYLNTKLSQIETAKILVEKLKSSLDYLIYNIKRYKVPIVMVMFYTQNDISKELETNKRLTDILVTIQIGDSYFNIVFLPFTELLESYNFIKHVEFDRLNKTQNHYHHDMLSDETNDYFSFINSYLFTIEQKSKENG